MSIKLTPRAQKAQRILATRGPNNLLVECVHCESSQVVSRDEDGSGAMEMWPCEGSPNCSEMLCEDCRATCDCCGQYSCAEHLKLQDGEHVCEVCAAEEMTLDCPPSLEVA